MKDKCKTRAVHGSEDIGLAACASLVKRSILRIFAMGEPSDFCLNVSDGESPYVYSGCTNPITPSANNESMSLKRSRTALPSVQAWWPRSSLCIRGDSGVKVATPLLIVSAVAVALGRIRCHGFFSHVLQTRRFAEWNL